MPPEGLPAWSRDIWAGERRAGWEAGANRHGGADTVVRVRWSLGRAVPAGAAALAAAGAVLAGLAAPAGAAAAAGGPGESAPVIIVGLPGLRWTDLSATATPALWRLAGKGSP